MSEPEDLQDLDFTSAPALEPAPVTPAMDAEALIGSRSLASGGYHVAIARARARPPSHRLVLVVEDDEDTAALAVRALENGGFVAQSAGDAKQAGVYLARVGVPALILLDVELPGLDGFRVLAKLRAHPKLSQVPVVMFTARATREDVLRGLALGADGYVVKPVRPAALLEVVNKVLGRAA